MNYMNSSFTRGVFLWLLLVVSMFTVFSLNEIVAQENVVTAKSTGFEETTIIEFENNGNSDIETFRMWLGADNSFIVINNENRIANVIEQRLISEWTEIIKP